MQMKWKVKTEEKIKKETKNQETLRKINTIDPQYSEHFTAGNIKINTHNSKYRQIGALMYDATSRR